MKLNHKAAYRPPPAKNIDEFKPAVPQTSTVAKRFRKKVMLDTPVKKADQETKPEAPDGAKWGMTVGMDRGE
ncbi:MAG: hypothetical protein WA485_23805 [Candidatus Sulfotelmatobacter sp.]